MIVTGLLTDSWRWALCADCSWRRHAVSTAEAEAMVAAHASTTAGHHPHLSRREIGAGPAPDSKTLTDEAS